MAKKIIFDVTQEMNERILQLCEKRGANRASMIRWAITKLLEEELDNVKTN